MPSSGKPLPLPPSKDTTLSRLCWCCSDSSRCVRSLCSLSVKVTWLTPVWSRQSEDKVKPVPVVPGHLQALEHVVRQDYFPKENVTVLQAFMSR